MSVLELVPEEAPLPQISMEEFNLQVFDTVNGEMVSFTSYHDLRLLPIVQREYPGMRYIKLRTTYPSYLFPALVGPYKEAMEVKEPG
jgi:hypothetical protein